MSRDYLTFGDIDGKLEMLRVECTRCPRRGRCSVAKLVAQHGRRGNLSKWVADLKGDCPKQDAHQLHERCDLICPRFRRRALVLLAGSADGATEAVMLAHGFSIDLLVELVTAGLATAQTDRIVAGKRGIEVARVKITKEGQRALSPDKD